MAAPRAGGPVPSRRNRPVSHLNAPLALAPPPISYDAWRLALDRICLKRLSLSLHDLPDLPTQGAYDAGTGPALFFEETVVSKLREDHGDLIDELLLLAGDHEDLLGDPVADEA
jgi:hypothetical protein